jgi:hypothetical protein
MKECEQRAIVKLEYRHNNEAFDEHVEEDHQMSARDFMHQEFTKQKVQHN